MARNIVNMRGISAVVLVAGLQMVSSQSAPPSNLKIPVECLTRAKTDARPTDCCVIPPFFSDTEFTRCGFKKFDQLDPKERHAPPDCSKQLCLLKRYNLLNEGTDATDSMNTTALMLYMDNWAAQYPDFLTVIEKAKDLCVGRPLPGPAQICTPNKLVFCISATLFGECPTWRDTADCTILKNHINLCRPYFRRTSDNQ